MHRKISHVALASVALSAAALGINQETHTQMPGQLLLPASIASSENICAPTTQSDAPARTFFVSCGGFF